MLLLEKAFAKVAGGYGSLAEVHISWAWQAMTGTEEQVCYVREAVEDLFVDPSTATWCMSKFLRTPSSLEYIILRTD